MNGVLGSWCHILREAVKTCSLFHRVQLLHSRNGLEIKSKEVVLKEEERPSEELF